MQLVADIGGTNARFALVGKQGTLSHVTVLSAEQFGSLPMAIEHFIGTHQITGLSHACIAVAAPVNDKVISLPNNPWHFTKGELEAATGCPVELINDFTAQVYALSSPQLQIGRWFGQARPDGEGTKAVVGAGTGLGVAALVAGGGLVDSEWGHISFAPTDDHQTALLSKLYARYSRVSVERLLSGMGLENIYWANSAILGQERSLTAPQIVDAAKQGDLLAIKVVGDFLDIYADVAGDIALAMGANQGVYLSGGILPRLDQFIDHARFRGRFEAKGRFNDYCAAVPLGMVATEQPGLLGCSQFLETLF